MAFCLEAEKFVDEKLSNWYIRRNRRRFWKSEHGRDKDAAYQTLYAVLVTLTKLIAPVVPFLAETIYQNLRQATDPESVHLCDYPQADERLIDQDLTNDMEALLGLVTLGSAARNSAKIKVRQPLAELRVQPSNEAERSAVRRFADQLCDELNVRRVTPHDSAQGPLLTAQVKPNLKALGPKAGKHLAEVKAAIEKLSVSSELTFPRQLSLSDGPFTLEAGDVVITYKAADGWAGAAEHGTMVALDTLITEELKLAGLAREVVRFVQELRKAADLQMEDRIDLYLGTDAPALKQAINAHRDYIAAETLTRRWADQPPPAAETADVKVDGQPLAIALR
jgi:isoleucyl-tRNA synthetase